jgi:hypothetical protein
MKVSKNAKDSMLMVKKPMVPNFESLRLIGLVAMIRSNSKKLNKVHDGALSIQNIVLNERDPKLII